jgi:UDP-N-acetylenolpyruvoylglucosamine reductase
MNVYEDPDQDLEAMCAWKLDDDLRNHYKVKKLAKVRNALKKAKISNTKPRTVIDSKGVVINDKDEEGVVRYDFQTWIQDIEKA